MKYLQIILEKISRDFKSDFLSKASAAPSLLYISLFCILDFMLFLPLLLSRLLLYKNKKQKKNKGNLKILYSSFKQEKIEEIEE